MVTWGVALADSAAAAAVAAKQQRSTTGKGVGGSSGGGEAAVAMRPRAVLCGLFGGWGALLLGTDRCGRRHSLLLATYAYY